MNHKTLLSLAFGCFATAPAIAQVLTASATTVTFQASAGSASQSAPPNSPVATPPLRVSAVTGTGGTASAACSSRLETLTDRIALETSLDVASTSWAWPQASATGDVLITLTSPRPVWGSVRMEWRLDGFVAPLDCPASVDVFDDGLVEFYSLGFTLPVTLPITFGPGSIRIRTRAAMSCRGSMEGASFGTGFLAVSLRPDAGSLTFTSTATTCGSLVPPVLTTGVDFERQVLFRLAGAPTGAGVLGVLVIGGQATSLPLPLPPQCRLLTDIALSRLLSPAELGGVPVICSPHGLATPFLLHVQALVLDVNTSTLLASNRTSIGSP